MKKVAVLFKEGFEELEALSVIDICRRAQIETYAIGMDQEFVSSSHQVVVKMDMIFNDQLDDFDAVVIPGGMPGAKNLRDDQRVLKIVKDFYDQNKLVCAICAGPIVLQEAGVLKNKKATCFPGFEEQIQDAIYQDTLVCQDGNVITGRGPAAGFMFGYTIIEALGYNCQEIKEGMQYHYLTKD